MGGWVEAKAGLRIAYSNQKYIDQIWLNLIKNWSILLGFKNCRLIGI